MLFKISLVPLVALVGTTTATLFLEREELTRKAFNISAMIDTVRYSDNGTLLFMAFLGIIGILYMLVGFSFSKKSDYYQSRLIEVTDKIKTPAAVGQVQHGSAKWMSEGQLEKAFKPYIINKKRSEKIAKLIKKGEMVGARCARNA